MHGHSNSLKFFDPSRGDFFNNHCPKCGCQTWASERQVQTLFNGKRYSHNVTNECVGVYTMEGFVWCNSCYKEIFEEHDG